jgi:hypothetical protein
MKNAFPGDVFAGKGSCIIYAGLVIGFHVDKMGPQSTIQQVSPVPTVTEDSNRLAAVLVVRPGDERDLTVGE